MKSQETRVEANGTSSKSQANANRKEASTGTGGDLSEMIRAFGNTRIAVLGDVMVDRFIWGKVARISPEAPVPVVDVDRSRDEEGYRLGGAANVAHNIVTLGGRAMVFGVVGDDLAGQQFWRLLASHGIDGRGTRMLAGRPTILKTRVVAHGQQVVRFDVEDRSPLPIDLVEALYDSLLERLDTFDAVVVSDYAKGVVRSDHLPSLIERLRKAGKHVVVDPKVRNLQAYVGATVITPNRQEACAGAMFSDELPEAAEKAGQVMLEQLQAEAVLVTLGEDGMLLLRPEGVTLRVPSRAAEVFDVTGAGDTVTAVLTLALSAGLDWDACVRMANAAAGVVVGKIGTATVDSHELEKAIRDERS